MRTFFFIPLFLGIVLMAQTKQYPIEDYEGRSHALNIQKRMQQEKASRNLRERNLRKLQARLATLAYENDADTKLKEALLLRDEIKQARDEISASSRRQMEIGAQIDAVQARPGLLPQAVNYLNEAREELRNMGIEQEKTRKQLDAMLPKLKTAIRNVPPPNEFTNRSGIKFRLVGKGQNAFYISQKPIDSDGNLTYGQIQVILDNLSAKENCPYSLPKVAQLKMLPSMELPFENAIWTSDIWQGTTSDVPDTLARFETTMRVVWDPASTLGRGAFFGELEFAHYPKLRAYAVTPSRTGWMIRWNTIQKQFME